MDRSAETALAIADRLANHPAVDRVIHPARPDHPDHAIFTRDFTAPAGVFGVEFTGWNIARSERFLDALKIFGLGFSWGGYESLAVHCDPQLRRQYWPERDTALIRLAIGLEHIDDLWSDLEQAIVASA
jgi:cystathionine beta-lyase